MKITRAFAENLLAQQMIKEWFFSGRVIELLDNSSASSTPAPSSRARLNSSRLSVDSSQLSLNGSRLSHIQALSPISSASPTLPMSPMSPSLPQSPQSFTSPLSPRPLSTYLTTSLSSEALHKIGFYKKNSVTETISTSPFDLCQQVQDMPRFFAEHFSQMPLHQQYLLLCYLGFPVSFAMLQAHQVIIPDLVPCAGVVVLTFDKTLTINSTLALPLSEYANLNEAMAACESSHANIKPNIRIIDADKKENTLAQLLEKNYHLIIITKTHDVELVIDHLMSPELLGALENQTLWHNVYVINYPKALYPKQPSCSKLLESIYYVFNCFSKRIFNAHTPEKLPLIIYDSDENLQNIKTDIADYLPLQKQFLLSLVTIAPTEEFVIDTEVQLRRPTVGAVQLCEDGYQVSLGSFRLQTCSICSVQTIVEQTYLHQYCLRCGGAITLQKCLRGYHARQELSHRHQAATIINAACRSYLVRKDHAKRKLQSFRVSEHTNVIEVLERRMRTFYATEYKIENLLQWRLLCDYFYQNAPRSKSNGFSMPKETLLESSLKAIRYCTKEYCLYIDDEDLKYCPQHGACVIRLVNTKNEEDDSIVGRREARTMALSPYNSLPSELKQLPPSPQRPILRGGKNSTSHQKNRVSFEGNGKARPRSDSSIGTMRSRLSGHSGEWDGWSGTSTFAAGFSGKFSRNKQNYFGDYYVDPTTPVLHHAPPIESSTASASPSRPRPKSEGWLPQSNRRNSIITMTTLDMEPLSDSAKITLPSDTQIFSAFNKDSLRQEICSNALLKHFSWQHSCLDEKLTDTEPHSVVFADRYYGDEPHLMLANITRYEDNRATLQVIDKPFEPRFNAYFGAPLLPDKKFIKSPISASNSITVYAIEFESLLKQSIAFSSIPSGVIKDVNPTENIRESAAKILNIYLNVPQGALAIISNTWDLALVEHYLNLMVPGAAEKCIIITNPASAFSTEIQPDSSQLLKQLQFLYQALWQQCKLITRIDFFHRNADFIKTFREKFAIRIANLPAITVEPKKVAWTINKEGAWDTEKNPPLAVCEIFRYDMGVFGLNSGWKRYQVKKP